MSEVVKRLRRAGFTVRTRRQWGTEQKGVYAYRLRTKPVDFPVDYGFLHITDTDKHGDEGMRFVEQIGMDRFGTGCSYNWVVDHEDHTIYEGQPLAAKGAHTINDKKVRGYPENLNYFGHAVAIMGKVEDPVCDECVELIAAIFHAERTEGVMRENAPVLPHRMFAAKACPGDKAVSQLAEINRLSVAEAEPRRKDRRSRVEKAGDLIDEALETLANVPKKRRHAHRVADQIEEVADKLPEK